MEAVIFIGLQGAGKSTFYKERFFNTHVRINLDMLKTRHREDVLLQACLTMKQPFVMDNTNPTIEARAKYILLARSAGFRVVGYYFSESAQSCIARNNLREANRRVPASAIFATAKKLQPPTSLEGFDVLYGVSISEAGEFVVAQWAVSEQIDG